MSAPAALGTRLSTIPGDIPYLWADAELTEHWRQELANIEGFKIGIAWQGSRQYAGDRWRSLPLAHFAPLARLPGVRLVSLQKGYGSEQLATVDFPVVDLAGRLDEAAGPFMDTAAVIRNLDLVVAPNSAVAHLAGALGARVFAALDYSADWRWLRDRDDSPWYPSVRLFRQTTFGQWPDVFERMAKAVEALQSESGEPRSMREPAGSPEDSTVLLALAHQEHLAGRLSEAAAAYRQVLAVRSDVAEVHNDLGTTLVELGQLEEALACFRQAIALKPDLALAHYNLAITLSSVDRLDEAVASFERAIALRPGYAEAYNNLALVLRNQGKLDQAVARLEQANALRPDHVEAHSNLGDLLASRGELDQAVAQLEQAIALEPNYPEAHNNLGNALVLQHKLEPAAAEFRQAAALCAEFRRALLQSGQCPVDARQVRAGCGRDRKSVDLAAAISRGLGRTRQRAGNADAV